MRRSSTGSRPGTVATKRSAGGAGAGTAGRPKTAQMPATEAEKDDYILNLKGQVYLLTIENEMMKKSVGEGRPSAGAAAFSGRSAAAGGASGGLQQMQQPTPASAVPFSVPSTGELLSAGLPPAQYPSEVSDSFELLRQRYTQLENKYQHDLEEARRGAEALASQCAAQSSLISTLKKEVATGLETLRHQKGVMQELEQRSNSDLEKAMRDIDSLQTRLEELNAIIASKGDEIAQKNTTMADLKSVAANAYSEKNAAEAARQRTLESYARVYMVSRYLLQRWRFERRDKLAVMESFERMRADKVRALETADRAVSESETARVAAEEAYRARDRALAAHRETQAAVNLVEQEVLRLQAELDVKSKLVGDMDALIPDLQRKMDVAQATASKAVAQKEAAIKRANELERLLADKAGECDEVRSAAVRAEERMREALGKKKGLEDELAGAHARVKTLEMSEGRLEADVERLQSDFETAEQRAAAAQAEIVQLRDELAKRPPIDIIKQLDVENLMQRNMQAAAAMHQLLAWRDAHEVHPSGMLGGVAGMQ